MFVLKFSTFEEKIEAPLTHVLSPGASIRENTVFEVGSGRNTVWLGLSSLSHSVSRIIWLNRLSGFQLP